MKVTGESTSVVMNNGIVKIQIDISAGPQPEYVLLNIVKERGEFTEGDIIEVSLKKVRRKR